MGQIKHIFSNAIADGTNTNIVRPVDWNSAHAYTMQDAVSLAGNTSGALANVSSGTLILAGGNNITLSQAGNNVTISAGNAAPSPVNFSAGGAAADLGSVVFSNSNGVSFGLNGSTITATVSTNYAGVGESVGTVAGTDLALTVNTDGVSILYPKWLTTAQPVGAYLTTARGSTDAIGLNTAKTNVTWTVNSSGLSLNAGGYAGTGFTSTTTAGTAIVGTNNTAGLSLGIPTFQTDVTSSIVGTSGISISTAGSTVSILVTASNVNGVSFGYSNGVLTGSVNTSYRASNDAVGLNTAKTNVTWTVNSSGLSFDAGGYAGTGFTSTTTAGTDVKGTHNTAGLSMAFPAWLTAAAGGNNLTLQDSATTLQVTKVIYSNLNGVSFGLATAASLATVTASVAAQSVQTVGLYATGNTTNNSSTTFDARTVGTWNALGAMTVGFSAGSIQLSAPATSSIVGTSGVSISTAGSTISVALVPMSYSFNNNAVTVAGSAQANSSVSLVPFDIDWPIVISEARVMASIACGSAANNSSASQAYSLSVVLYTRNSDSLSSVWTARQSSNSFWTSNNTTLLAGVRALIATGVATTLTPNRYYAAIHLSTTNTGTGGATTALGCSYSMIVGVPSATAALQGDNWNGGATNQSRAFFHGLGLYATGASKASYALSDAAFTHTGNSASLASVGLNLRNWSLF